MDGVVTRQELAPSSEPGQSTLTITGEDLSVLMDVVEIKRPFPAIERHAAEPRARSRPTPCFGITPIVLPPIIDTS